MAYKAPISKQEKKLDQTVQAMHALVRNEFRGDFVSAPKVEQARDFAQQYLPAMEDMLGSLQSLRQGYNSIEKQFSSAMDKMPDLGDKAIVYAGTGAAQIFGIVGSVGSIFSDNIATPKEVIVTLTKERQDFFEGMDDAHKSVVGDPQGKTPEQKKGTMQVFREEYSKAYFVANDLAGAVLEGKESVAEQKATELTGALKSLKKASRGLNSSLYILNAYTNSMTAIQTRVKKMTVEMALAVAGSIAAAKAIELGAKGLHSFYAATSSAGRLATAGAEVSFEMGVAGAETTFAGSAAMGLTATAKGAKALEQAAATTANVEKGMAASQTLKRSTEVVKKAVDVHEIEAASHSDFEQSFEMAPPSF